MFDLGPPRPVELVAGGARTLGELFQRRAAATADRPAHFEHRDGAWRAISWQAFHDRAARVAAGALAFGLARGDRIAILGPTQPAWGAYDLGGQLAGMVTFGIYPKQSADQVRYLLEHSEAKLIFVDDPEEVEVVLAAARDLPTLRAIVPWSEELYRRFADRDPRVTSPARFEGAPASDAELRAIQDAIAPTDTAILIYTSGTTGHPKGAMIAHRNILAMVGALIDVLEYLTSDLSLHFLPMAHAAERLMFYGRVNTGIAGAYARSAGTVLEDLQTVRPTFFGSVPRIYEKAHAKIHAELERQRPAVRKVFAWACRVGRARLAHQLAGERVPLALAAKYRIADRLVFRKLRGAFGGRVRAMVTGAAPIAPAILEFFWLAGLPILEAYGMTEATCVTHCNRPGSVKLGSVGQPVAGMECRLADDGEILLRGPLVFNGYFKQPEATAEALVDGWLHTGDVGTLDGDGFLAITDRKKHLIITANGKNISPANIEKAIKEQDPLIAQVHAHGDRRSYVSAIVAPSPLETLEWGIPRGLCTRDELAVHQAALLANPTGRSAALHAAMAKVVGHPELHARLRDAVGRGNQQLAHHEQVRRFVILDRDFSQEHGELTPTMKQKRRELELKYAALFGRVYGEDGFALEPA